MSQIKPLRPALLVIQVFAFLILFAYLMPEPKKLDTRTVQYMYLGDTITLKVNSYAPRQIDYTLFNDTFKIKYFSATDIFKKKYMSKKNIEEAVVEEIETFEDFSDTELSQIDTVHKDSVHHIDLDKILAKKMRIQYPEGNHKLLHNFFRSLARIQEGELIRVLHFGDSQIEADRVTSQLRHELQQEFGGCGVGLVPIMEPTNARISIKVEEDKKWFKDLVYKGKYDKDKPKDWGILGAWYRFNEKYPEKPVIDPNDTVQSRVDSLTRIAQQVDSIISLRKTERASVTFTKSKKTYESNRTFDNMKVLYGRSMNSSKLKISANGDTINTFTLKASNSLAIEEYEMSNQYDVLTLTFEGKESPDVYGVSFDCDQGIAVDNIAFRGSSGVEINRLDRTYMREQLRKLDVELIILQFGINVVPGKWDEDYNYFGIFNSPIRAIRQWNPNVSIVVVSLSDMSQEQEDGTFTTYPNVEDIRNAQRAAAYKNNCAFFDLYEAMGGENSMPSWVEKGYAAKDYTHFSSSGARIVSKMLFRALMLEYEVFKKVAQ